MHRKDILTNAITHTCGERDKEYGSPKQNLADIAALWKAHLFAKYGVCPPLTAEDVAWMMVDTKKARTYKGVTKADTYEDAAAYAAIAGECATPTVPIVTGGPQQPKCYICGGAHYTPDGHDCIHLSEEFS